MFDTIIKILIIIGAVILIGLNVIAIINDSNIVAIIALVVLVVGSGFLIFQFRRRQFTSGRWGCSNCWLPILGVSLLLWGAYSGVQVVQEVAERTPPPTHAVAIRTIEVTRDRATATAEGTPIPPTRTPFPTDTARPCFPMSQAATLQEGSEVCLYGIVENITRDELAQYVGFSGSDFRLVTYNQDFTLPYSPGQCVQQTGELRRLGTRLIIVIEANDIFVECALAQTPTPSG
jgi:hypothetical protein